MPKDALKRRGYLTHQQVQQLAAAAATVGRDQDSLTVRFMAYTGLRIGELSGLTVADVNPTTRRVWVLGAKTSKARSIPFPPSLTDELTALCASRSPSAPLFPTVRHQHWQETVFNEAVAGVREADTTFPLVTPHDLRHTAASLAVSAGANVLAVSRMLGHAKPSITLNTYADLFDSDLDTVAVNMDAAITTARNPYPDDSEETQITSENTA